MIASYLKSLLRRDFSAAGLALLMAAGGGAVARDLSSVNAISKANPISKLHISCETDTPRWKVACSDPVPFTLPAGINNHGVSVGLSIPDGDFYKTRNVTVFEPFTAPRDIFAGSGSSSSIEPVGITNSGKIPGKMYMPPDIVYGVIYTPADISLAPQYSQKLWEPLARCEECIRARPTPIPFAMSLTDDILIAGEYLNPNFIRAPNKWIVQKGNDTTTRRIIDWQLNTGDFSVAAIAHVDGAADDYYVVINVGLHEARGTFRGIFNYRTATARAWESAGDSAYYFSRTVDKFGNIGGWKDYFNLPRESYKLPFIQIADGTLFHINVTIESNGGESCRPKSAYIDNIDDGLHGVGHLSGCGLSDAGFSFRVLKDSPRSPAAALPPSLRPAITRLPQPMPGH